MANVLAAPTVENTLTLIDQSDQPTTLQVESSGSIDYETFLRQVEARFLNHPIVLYNPYTRWFQQGGATVEDLRAYAVQFSVFSNQFLIAQLMKIINADSLESARATKEIFANEIGVIFRNSRAKNAPTVMLSADEKERHGDPDLVSTEGTVDGGIFRFRASHYEWFVQFAEGVGLRFCDMGKRSFGTPETHFFCDELFRLYGSEDSNLASGASFALENWSAAGFWQELEDGLLSIKAERMPHLSIAFFTWHNRLEAQHAQHTHAELREIYDKPNFNYDKFMRGGQDMLDALAILWRGLYNDVRTRHPELPEEVC